MFSSHWECSRNSVIQCSNKDEQSDMAKNLRISGTYSFTGEILQKYYYL